jgi:Fe-S oxidoreductase
MSEIERVLENCSECGLCMEDCDFLSKAGKSPKELALTYMKNGFKEEPQVPYSCNICGLCQSKCPYGLDTGKMLFEARQEMVRHGIGPLKQHEPLQKAQQLYISEAVKASIPSTDQKTKRVFFPGCALSAYSPALVIKTYEHLAKKLPGTGIMLGCCVGPAHLIGDMKTSGDITDNVAAEAKRLGATEIIAACPFCYKLLKETHPELHPVSLYTVLDEIGIPGRRRSSPGYTIHDPCTTRYEPEIQESVRSILGKAGLGYVETGHCGENTRCCGMGGMAYAVDPGLGKKISKHTIDEAPSDIVTYCATCRETLAGEGGHVVHLLDLIFNPRWKKASALPAKSPRISSDNMRKLKKKLTVKK